MKYGIKTPRWTFSSNKPIAGLGLAIRRRMDGEWFVEAQIWYWYARYILKAVNS